MKRALAVLLLAAVASAADVGRIVETEVVSHDAEKLLLSMTVAFDAPPSPSYRFFFQVRLPDGALAKDGAGADVLVEATSGGGSGGVSGGPGGTGAYRGTLEAARLSTVKRGETTRLRIEAHVWDGDTSAWVVSGFDRATPLVLSLDAVGRIASAEYAEVWAERLVSGAVEARRAAVDELRELAAPPARTAGRLAKALASDADELVRRGAILALRHLGLGNDAARAAIAEARKDKDGWVRYYGAEALLENPDDETLETLGRLLDEAEFDLRNCAASALKSAGKRSVKSLEAAQKRGGEGALPAAATLLAIGAGGKESMELLLGAIRKAFADGDEKTGWTWANALEETSAESAAALPPLTDLVNAPDFGLADRALKLAALRTLAKFGAASKGALLGIERLKSDPDEVVRDAAKEAVQAIQGR